MFSAVEESRPNRITIAIGVWISLPGSPPLSASGTRARPAASAVINMGAKRSKAPGHCNDRIGHAFFYAGQNQFLLPLLETESFRLLAASCGDWALLTLLFMH